MHIASTNAISRARPDPARILVVDDEESLRHLLRVILEREGYLVLEAANGEAALHALDDQPEVRVVLCDLRMPRLDGLAFLEKVRNRGLQVVLMSAYGSSETAVDALGRGAFDYISKPFRADEIRACVRRILARDLQQPAGPTLVEVEAAPVTTPRPVIALDPDDGRSDLSIKRHTAELERHLIALALARTDGNRSQAARMLDISYKALVYKIRDYGLGG